MFKDNFSSVQLAQCSAFALLVGPLLPSALANEPSQLHQPFITNPEKPISQVDKAPLTELKLPMIPSQTEGMATPEADSLYTDVSDTQNSLAISTQAEDLLSELTETEPPQPMLSPSDEDNTLAQVNEVDRGTAEIDLREQSQNPVANLISLPFQNNTNFGVGQFDRTQNILNIQPVIPTALSEDLLLINRVIVPLVYQPDLAPGVGDVVGLGDINPTFFFSPKNSSGNITWGAGPTFLLPTATDSSLGTGKWAAGPAAVAVVTTENLVFGGLASQIWSFAGDSSRADVSQFLAQPFINYNLPDGWFLTSAPVITANWQAAAGEQWTVPLGGGFGRVFAIGNQPVSASLQAYWNAVTPTNGAEWSLRAAMSLLFPTQ